MGAPIHDDASLKLVKRKSTGVDIAWPSEDDHFPFFQLVQWSAEDSCLASAHLEYPDQSSNKPAADSINGTL